MPDFDAAAWQGSLNTEQKTHIENTLKKAAEDAVTKFKTESEDARKKAIPDKYTLKATDNSPLDPKGDLDQIAAYAREQGWSNEQAAKHLAHVEALASGVVARNQQAFTEQLKAWETATWGDKDLGGANKDATLKSVKAVMDKFGSPELAELVNQTGYGNHIAFVRFVAAIGKAMQEDRPFGGRTDPTTKLKTNAEVFYGTA